MTRSPDFLRETAKLFKRIGAHLDEMSHDLARDAGNVVRNARDLAHKTADNLDAKVQEAEVAAGKARAKAAAFVASTARETVDDVRTTAADVGSAFRTAADRLEKLATNAAANVTATSKTAASTVATEVAGAYREVATALRQSAEGLDKVASASADDFARAYHEAAADLATLADDIVADVSTAANQVAGEVATTARGLNVSARQGADELARAYREMADDVARLRTNAGVYGRATPRATRIAMAATALFARQRWLRLRALARGQAGLSDDDQRDLARRATAQLAQLRGGIAKLGQLASCRPDLVGPVWARELASLQDDVPPIDAAKVRARIEAELPRTPATPDDAAVPDGESVIAHRFGSFDDTPIAAASLAQVHGATLPDGTRVVIKVQVPGIEDVIAADVAALRAVSGMIGEIPGVDLPMLTDELGRALGAELDYVAEATALEQFAGGTLVVPRPIRALSTARVLTMTRLDGHKLTTYLDAADPAERDRVLGEVVTEITGQVLLRGHVHADPHPGNFLVTPDGKLAMLDFGCTLALSPDERRAYARLVFAIAGNDSDGAAKQLAGLGFTCDDPQQLVALTQSIVGALRPGTSVAEVDWTAAFGEQIAKAKQLGGLTIPRSFVLLGRVLATVAGLLAHYKPAIHLHPLIAKHLMAAMA